MARRVFPVALLQAHAVFGTGALRCAGIYFACKLIAVLAGCLGRVHGVVCSRQERVKIVAVRREERNSDTRMHPYRAPRHIDVFAGGGNQLLGHHNSNRRFIDFRQQHDKFVAAGARDDVIVTSNVGQALRHPTQQRIAVSMSEQVVEFLEPIEIDHQYRR